VKEIRRIACSGSRIILVDHPGGVKKAFSRQGFARFNFDLESILKPVLAYVSLVVRATAWLSCPPLKDLRRQLFPRTDPRTDSIG